MSRCADVQNVSRPIDMCHEMSQYTPTITHVAPRRTVWACQSGADRATLRSFDPTVVPGWTAIAMNGIYYRIGTNRGPLEQTYLLPEILGIHDRLPDEPLKLARRFR